LREKERYNVGEKGKGDTHTTGKRERGCLDGWEREKEIKVHWQNTYIFYAFLSGAGIWQLKVHIPTPLKNA
jgi:hypothetical protein